MRAVSHIQAQKVMAFKAVNVNLVLGKDSGISNEEKAKIEENIKGMIPKKVHDKYNAELNLQPRVSKILGMGELKLSFDGVLEGTRKSLFGGVKEVHKMLHSYKSSHYVDLDHFDFKKDEVKRLIGSFLKVIK